MSVADDYLATFVAMEQNQAAKAAEEARHAEAMSAISEESARITRDRTGMEKELMKLAGKKAKVFLSGDRAIIASSSGIQVADAG